MLDKSSAHKKYEFKKKLERLRAKTGRGTELISLYIPQDKQIYDVTSQLRDEHGQAANIKSKSTRLNVQSALESTLARLKYIQKIPENGIVIFCGALDVGANKTSMETLVIDPPEPITSYKYFCASSFLLEPLEAMLKDKKTFGLIVVDRREATVGLMQGKHVERMGHLTSAVPGKQRKGGQSAQRFQQLRLIAIHDFNKRIGDMASNVFLKVDRKDFEGILIGGPSPTKEEFYNGEFLHHELHPKVIKLLDVSYTDESGLHELVDAAMDTLSDIDVMKEKLQMQKFFRELTSDSGLAAYGEESVRQNLLLGAVGVLILSEDLRKLKRTWTCSSCGFTKDDSIVTRPGELPDTKAQPCPKCKSNFTVTESVDVVDELSELADSMNTTVEFISTDFEEGDQLMTAFGGIAAVLRYKTDM